MWRNSVVGSTTKVEIPRENELVACSIKSAQTSAVFFEHICIKAKENKSTFRSASQNLRIS